MADTPNQAPSVSTPIDGASATNVNNPIKSTSNFLTETPSVQKSEDMLYNDFFQENEKGEITLGVKKERAGLEIVVNILEYVTILVVIIGIISALHVFIRSSKDTSFLESYPLLCPYLHYDIKNVSEEEMGCKNIGAIGNDYNQKNDVLNENILTALTEFIPIKVSSSILDTSPEKQFIIKTYNSKPHVNNVLAAFEKVKLNAQKFNPNSPGEPNIKCSGITVVEGNILSTQCVIYGGDIGSDNTNLGIGSARIEALDFIEKIANTTKSSLVLYNFPTTLNIETIVDKESLTPGFSTRTSIPIQVGYVPIIEKF